MIRAEWTGHLRTDHWEDCPWQRLVVAPTGYRDALVAAGVNADVFALPAMGIKGNTHMMMMDRNSDDIARLISDWLAKQGLTN